MPIFHAGQQTPLGPKALTPNAYSQIDITPTADLPSGVSVTWEYDLSRDGGATWRPRLGPTTSVGPVVASQMNIGTSENVPAGADYMARLLWSIAGGNWNTDFTINETVTPNPQ